MAYLSQERMDEMGFNSLGLNVKISDKASIYNADRIQIGDNSRIDDFCVISGTINIGAFVHVAAFCLLAGGEEGIVIGDFSGVAYASQIFSQSDDYTGAYLTSPLIPSEYKLEKKSRVTLGRHVIIGASSVVFPGVTLAEGSSIGAMSLVTKSTEAWGVYTGIPAKRVKERKRDMLELEQKFIKEHNINIKSTLESINQGSI
jgi:acetyltransferase-like isoleucine patch superfamily enzyme